MANKIHIKVDTCKGCGLCVGSCPKKILELSKHEINKMGYNYVTCIDVEKCIGCTMCAVMCPDCALEVY